MSSGERGVGFQVGWTPSLSFWVWALPAAALESRSPQASQRVQRSYDNFLRIELTTGWPQHVFACWVFG